MEAEAEGELDVGGRREMSFCDGAVQSSAYLFPREAAVGGAAASEVALARPPCSYDAGVSSNGVLPPMEPEGTGACEAADRSPRGDREGAAIPPRPPSSPSVVTMMNRPQMNSISRLAIAISSISVCLRQKAPGTGFVTRGSLIRISPAL